MDCIKGKPTVTVSRTISCTPEDLRNIASLMDMAAKPDHEVIVQITNDLALVYKQPFDTTFSPTISRETPTLPAH